MKRILSLIAVALILLSSFALMASAAEIPSERQVPRFVDNADIIPDNEEAEILSLVDSISEDREIDVGIVTVASTGGANPMDFADDYYDYNGFGFGENRDGILLLISMDPRRVQISTCGKGMKIVSNDAIDPLIDTFFDDITAGDYASACKTFAKETDSKINSYNMRPVILIPIAFGIGFIIASIIVGGYKSKQKNTVRFNDAATNYTVANSLMVANSTDNFLYSNVTRVPIPKNTSSSSGGTHVSSSGTSHGGGGRSF